MINAQAYIKQGRLCIMGVHDTKLGPVPFAHSCPIEEEADGPINLNDMSPAVNKVIEESVPKIMAQVNNQAVQLAAQNVIERARAGDQVAMATLAMVREAAMKGVEKARIAYDIMRVYIKDHPSVAPKIAGESNSKILNLVRSIIPSIRSKDITQYSSAVKSILPSLSAGSINTAAVTLSNGAELLGKTNPRISAIIADFNPQQRKAFSYALQNCGNQRKVFGVARKLSPEENEALQIGLSIGIARKIQAVRKTKKVSILSRMAAWELGE